MCSCLHMCVRSCLHTHVCSWRCVLHWLSLALAFCLCFLLVAFKTCDNSRRRTEED